MCGKHHLMFLSYLHEAAERWHWLRGCAGVFINRQPCSRALETDPICSRPGWVVKNSSKCGPQGFTPPPHTSRALLSLHLQHLCLIAEGGELGRGCKCSAPTEEEEWWWGDVGPQRWSRKVTQWKWSFLGVIHAHTSIRAGLRPGGECGNRRWWGCCCVFCLASHPCAAEAEHWAWAGAAPFFLSCRESPKHVSHELFFFFVDSESDECWCLLLTTIWLLHSVKGFSSCFLHAVHMRTTCPTYRLEPVSLEP